MEKGDNWEHRSRTLRCRTCMWYVSKKSLSGNVTIGIQVGRCRRRSPTLGGWPVVFEGDWCGDHKLDEEKQVGELVAAKPAATPGGGIAP